MICKIIIVIGIICCITAAVSILNAPTTDIYTLDYRSDFEIDKRGNFKLEIYHSSVKKAVLWLEYDRYGYLVENAAESRIPLKMVCVKYIFSSKKSIKQVWCNGKRIY